MYNIFLLCLVFLQVQSASVIRSNVCTDYKYYGNSIHADHCYYNPDLDSTPSEIADRHGFVLNEFNVTTEDGYILTLFRLGLKNDSNTKLKQPVVLQHGILVDARSWIISGKDSLGFILSSSGNDLWMPNFRGTTYSSKHVNSSITQKEYWNFSFHEMGIYDIPVIMEFVANTTKRNDIFYIGHSMGCTAFMVYSSVKADHSQKYTKGILYLAPVVFFSNPPFVLKLVLPFTQLINNILTKLNVYAVGNLPEIQGILSKLTCSSYPYIAGCHAILSIFTGLVIEQIRPEVFPLMINLFPTGISLKALVHFAQIILNNGTFQQFDYGTKINIQKYNSTKPPVYHVEEVKIPTHVFAGKQDFLSEIEDVHNLYNYLRGPKKLHTYKLSHLDYIYGKDLKKLYSDIIDTLRNNSLNKT